ncbi:hypothetical protein ACPA0F_18630 [Solibacillus silvestris]
MAKTEGQRRSQLQERRITKNLKEIGMEARTQMASGAIWFAKSDVISELFQIEAKTRAAKSKSISVKEEWHDKIEQEAFETNKIGVLVYSFGGNTDYFSMKDRDFLSLIEELVELRRFKEEQEK